MSGSKIFNRWIPFGLCLFFASGVWGKTEQKDAALLLKITSLKSGLKLRYTLSLPSGYSPAKTYPLVVALHYGGKVTPFYGFEFFTALVEPALKEFDAVFIVPDCPSMGWVNPTSEEAVLELILLMMETYSIDADRVLILGFSMGGLGTWHLASRHPDIFSAAIPIAAPADTMTTPSVKDVPFYIIHGENDEVFPLDEVMRFYLEQKAEGADIQLLVVEKTNHYDLSRYIVPLKAAIPWIKRVWEENLKR